MITEKTKKLLPCGASKSQIYGMYPMESENYLRKLIHSIMLQNNKHLTETEIKRRKRINRKEMEELIDVMGVPRGYENQFKD